MLQVLLLLLHFLPPPTSVSPDIICRTANVNGEKVIVQCYKFCDGQWRPAEACQ